jgi:hypothetical protein
MDMQTYCQQHFGMFTGEMQRITIRFTNNLLDTVIDRFGSESNVFYSKTDDRHFSVTTDVALSHQFYGWLCGFWKQAVITSPPEAVEGFRKFLSDINNKYESE